LGPNEALKFSARPKIESGGDTLRAWRSLWFRKSACKSFGSAAGDIPGISSRHNGASPEVGSLDRVGRLLASILEILPGSAADGRATSICFRSRVRVRRAEDLLAVSDQRLELALVSL